MAEPAATLIEVPFGSAREERASPRYAWDNAARGSDPFVIFQCTLRGEGRFECNGAVHPVPAGHALIALLPERSRYFYPPGGRGPWAFSWVNFYGELGLRLWGDLRRRGGPVVALSPEARRVMARLAALTRRGDPYARSAAAYALYLAIARTLPPPRGRALSPLDAAIDRLRGRYREPLRVKEIAAEAGMSREHFTRLFAARTGESPAAFLRAVRLDAAARLLRTTRLPLAEVALRCGFAGATKLGVFFKRRHRLTPRAYRLRHGGRGAAESL